MILFSFPPGNYWSICIPQKLPEHQYFLIHCRLDIHIELNCKWPIDHLFHCFAILVRFDEFSILWCKNARIYSFPSGSKWSSCIKSPWCILVGAQQFTLALTMLVIIFYVSDNISCVVLLIMFVIVLVHILSWD